MSINQSMKPVLALLIGLLLLGIIVIMFRTFNLLPDLTRVEPLAVDSQNADFTPEIPVTSASRTPSATPNSLAVTSTPAGASAASKTILTTRARHVALRAGPHINHPGASKNFDQGTRMEVLGTHEGWYFVIAPDGSKGWLYEEWLNINMADLTNIPIIMIVPTAPLNTRVPPERDPQEPRPNAYP
jgi:hypothetical protein